MSRRNWQAGGLHQPPGRQPQPFRRLSRHDSEASDSPSRVQIQKIFFFRFLVECPIPADMRLRITILDSEFPDPDFDSVNLCTSKEISMEMWQRIITVHMTENRNPESGNSESRIVIRSLMSAGIGCMYCCKNSADLPSGPAARRIMMKSLSRGLRKFKTRNCLSASLF
jgi:hypothetical protein